MMLRGDISPFAGHAFLRWLGASLDMRDPQIVEARAPAAGGWSSETHLITVRDATRQRRIVLRLAPSGPAMFPEYDLGRQVACMRTLRDVPGCPVPTILADDIDGAVIGRPLYVMDFIKGDIPSDDRPTLFEAGFLFDASPTDQHKFHLGLLSALAALHAAACPPSLKAKLARSVPGATALARELAWLRAVFDWGKGPTPQPALEDALARLEATLPADSTECLLWGDARPANVVVRDFAPAALLDWELAAIGPPELDLFWLLEMNRMRARGRSLPGFPGDDETVALYKDLTDRRLTNAAWHVLFAATKVAILMLRHLSVRVALGDMAQDHPVLRDNIATRRLQALLE